VTDLRSLWDFDDPAGSEQRFRAAADLAEGTDRLVLLTQVARALGLQERYDEGHALLDQLAVTDDEVAARVSIERGRLLRSAGDPDAARLHFEAAEQHATGDALRIDALHMAALVAPPEERLAVNERALAIARASDEPDARAWDASLLNNIGMVHADAGDWSAALAAFEQALAARRRLGGAADVRVARWMVAWAMRHLGRTAEALAEQEALRAELDAIGATDPYVDEELALLRT
jgi:tetratricopeptide (TPR) repeat protein